MRHAASRPRTRHIFRLGRPGTGRPPRSPADPSTIDPSLRHPNHILRGAAPRSCSSPTENTHTNHHRHTYMRKTPACTLQLSNQRGRQHSTTTTPAALCCAPLSPLHNLTLLCVQWVVRACSSRAPTPAPWAVAHLAAAHILSRMVRECECAKRVPSSCRRSNPICTAQRICRSARCRPSLCPQCPSVVARLPHTRSLLCPRATILHPLAAGALNDHSPAPWASAPGASPPPGGMHERATLSKRRSISGAQRVKPLDQNL